jgi:hypothetical protein
VIVGHVLLQVNYLNVSYADSFLGVIDFVEDSEW